MKWAVRIARTLLGLVFLLFGLDHFLHFLNMPPPENMPEGATSMMKALVPTGYLHVVKVLEVTGGLLLVTGQYVPLGITLLMPVIVNILLFDLLLMQKVGLGLPLFALAVFLIAGYWRHFKAVFTRRAEIGWH